MWGKSKRTTKCDKITVTCDVETAQCEDGTIKCEKKVKAGYLLVGTVPPLFWEGYDRIT